MRERNEYVAEIDRKSEVQDTNNRFLESYLSNRRLPSDKKMSTLENEEKSKLDSINKSTVSKHLGESGWLNYKYPHPVLRVPKKSPLLGYQSKAAADSQPNSSAKYKEVWNWKERQVTDRRSINTKDYNPWDFDRSSRRYRKSGKSGYWEFGGYKKVPDRPRKVNNEEFSYSNGYFKYYK